MTDANATIQLRPMTPDELVTFRAGFIRAWADDLAKVEDLDDARALAEATARTDADLPLGVASLGHHLFTILAGAEAVGSLWFSIDARGRAFLDEVQVAPPERGRGYGRRAIELAEAEARRRGATHIELNVYQHNARARALYEALGYRATKLTMRKTL
jgi:GNAT superfamily N-acetyltransferase